MGVCKILHKKIYALFQKSGKNLRKKACVLGTTLILKLSIIIITMNVLENGFGVRTERIRSGSKSKPIRTKKNFLNLSLIKRKSK